MFLTHRVGPGYIVTERKTPPEGGVFHLRPLGTSRTRCRGVGRRRGGRQTTFALGALAGKLTGTTNGLGLLARLLLGGLLVVVPELHLPENAFALQLLLQRAERLIDIVIANNYLQAEPPFDIVISV